MCINRYTTDKFSEERRPTVGSDFLTKKLKVHDLDVFLQVWDTAGQERFHQGTISSAFYRGAHGALLVYDVNNEKSIDQLAQWRDECISRQDPNIFFPIVVVGNKADLRDQIPETERIDQSGVLAWCRENQYGHMESSAKDGVGVEASMLAITALALDLIRLHPNKKEVNNTIQLEKKFSTKGNSFCSSCG